MRDTLIAPFIFQLVLVVLLLVPTVASAFDVNVKGYLRTRLVYYHDLDTQQPNPNVDQGGLGDNDRFGSMLFLQERLRIEPVFKINDNISIQAQIDAPDNIIAGTEDVKTINFTSPIIGTIQLPGAGGAYGVVGSEAGENKAINFRRAYMDILTPGGKLRIGRQPSHWGLGILTHDGNGFNDDFGDTFDRILYLASLETKKYGTINFGGLADFVFTEQEDPRISGIGSAITSPAKDTRQFVGVFLYDYKGFSIGTFSGLRYRNGDEGTTRSTARQILVDANGVPVLDSNGNFQLSDPVPAGQDGDTNLYFADVYGEYKTGPYRFRTEYALLWGKLSTGLAIDAIPFNNLPNNALGPIELPAQNDILVNMLAAEFEAKYKFGTFLWQGGYASGDAEPISSKITQFGFRPDYQIALLLFHTPLGSSPRVTQSNPIGGGGRTLVGAVPVTGNYINNAIYTTVGYAHNIDMSTLVPNSTETKAGIKFITAWAPSNTFEIDFGEIVGDPNLPSVVNSNKWYGWEADVNLQSRFFERFLFDLTAGFLFPGPAYDVEVAIFDPSNLAQINVIPFDGANWVWGIRTNLIVDF